MQWTSAPNIAGAPLPQRARGYWKARISAAREGLEKLLEAERAQLPPWFVVGFGSGHRGLVRARHADASGRRSCASPPRWRSSASCSAAARRAGARLVRARGDARLRAGLGAVRAGSPQPRLSGPWSRSSRAGRSVDYLAAKAAVRLTAGAGRRSLPPRVRVSIDDEELPAGIAPGAVIRLRARLAPPPPMALPGTYDFARDAWFKGIGAVGKALGPVTVVRRPNRTAWTGRGPASATYRREPSRSPGRDRDRARHGRPECGRPG